MVPTVTSHVGILRARFARDGVQTQLRESFQRPPLQILRPFWPEPNGACHAVLLHNGGGIVARDRLSLELTLEPAAHVVATTASAGKLYRSEGPTATQAVTLTLGEDSYLEWLPQETIAFDASRFRQDLTLQLAPGARFLGWEVVRFGRSARGERFVSGEWRSHLEAFRDEAPLWIDRQWLPGSEEVWQSAHGLANRPVVGSLVFLGLAVNAEGIARVRDAAADLSGEWGASRLPEGLLCRYRGDSSEEARRWFMRVWAIARAWQGLPDPAIPRVWHPF